MDFLDIQVLIEKGAISILFVSGCVARACVVLYGDLYGNECFGLRRKEKKKKKKESTEM